MDSIWACNLWLRLLVVARPTCCWTCACAQPTSQRLASWDCSGLGCTLRTLAAFHAHMHGRVCCHGGAQPPFPCPGVALSWLSIPPWLLRAVSWAAAMSSAMQRWSPTWTSCATVSWPAWYCSLGVLCTDLAWSRCRRASSALLHHMHAVQES